MTLKLGRLGLVILGTVACAHAPAQPANEAAAPAGPAPASTPESAGGVAAAGRLHGYLVKLKCGAPQDSRSCKLSSDQERSRLDVVLAGDAGRVYDVKVRVRGLVEPRRYSGGALLDPSNKWLYAGGAPDPLRKNNGQAYNIYQIAVSDPKQDHFLNRDTDDHLGGGYVPSHSTFKVDYVIPLKVRGGATVSVITDDQAGSGMINNADKQIVEGVPADRLPQPWDGQFFYLEVESVTPAS
jgi:hypothetical protein